MTGYALGLDDAAVRRFLLAARMAERAERDRWADAGISAGATVADVGCGPGAVTVLLGNRVEPGGSVVGVDGDPAALDAARRLAGATGAENVLFSEGDAASTGLAPGTFDVVMLRHVLGHNGERAQAIVDHIRSLLRKGGWEARDAMSSAGFARPEDTARWQEAFERLDAAEDAPALFVPIFTAAGRLAG